jgi:DNA mismatch repair protein MutS
MTQTDGMPRLLEELGRVEARELLVPQDPDRTENWWRQRVSVASVQMMAGDSFGRSKAERSLLEQFKVVSLEGFGVRDMPLAVRAGGAILGYVQQTQFQKAEHIRRLVPYRRSDYMIVDEVTTRHLELLRSSYGGGRKGTLLDVLDLTVTAMGARLLRHWVLYPLLQPHEINPRQDAIAWLREHEAIRAQVRHELEKVYDLERLTGRVTMGSANPRDLGALRRSLESLPRLKHLLGHLEDGVISQLGDRLDPLGDVARILQEALVDNPPPNLTEGGVIRSGYNGELDRLLTLSRDAKKWIARLEGAERQKTGIASLKVGYNRIFGYYLEVSKANLGLVPDRYVRKQTLVNAERYITEELREYETEVVTAEERRIRLEEDLFRQLRLQVADEGHRIQASAAVVAELDVLAALAEVANRRNYCRPVVDDGPTIAIEEGRHPTVEASVPRGTYVPNDIQLDNESRQVIIITGPNMSGKSTILRQVALILLMAQMGMPVPATSARIGIVDRIFTRVGATDELTRGRSTFMVEMQETAHILHQATPRSLVILDEIGRGTSTFDGLSIARAVAEYLHDWEDLGMKTLFATHYHELTDLASTRPRVKNMNVAVKEWGDQVIFLHKLVEGGTNRSYGIHVARLAGLPASVVERAREILQELERGNTDAEGLPRLARSAARVKNESYQLGLFQQPDRKLGQRLEELDLERLTPLEALNELARLKAMGRGEPPG